MERRAAKQAERDARLRVLLMEVLTGQTPEHVRQRVGEALALLSPATGIRYRAHGTKPGCACS